MRRFVVIGHQVPVEPGIDLDDLAGNAGRLDVLCRCVAAALLHSHGIRADSELVTVHRDDLSLRFSGESLRGLRPDERSIAGRFDAALADAGEAVGHREVSSSPGVAVSRRDLAGLLADVEGPIVQLHPAGEPIVDWDPGPATFVLSDHRPFAPADDEVLDEHADIRLRVGPIALHADQAIAIVHNYLDTDGYAAYGRSEPL